MELDFGVPQGLKKRRPKNFEPPFEPTMKNSDQGFKTIPQKVLIPFYSKQSLL